MAALAPSQNAAGVPRPVVPANPATLGDITNAKEYVDRLSSSKLAAHPNAATNLEIGAAEAYKAAVIFSHSPGANVAPAWLLNLNATVQQIANDVADLRRKSDEIATDVADLRRKSDEIATDVAYLRRKSDEIATDVAYLRRKSDELPILLANSQNGWALPLAAPNPRTRDELLGFTSQQCIAPAGNLGLPVLPQAANVLERRRQIAV